MQVVLSYYNNKNDMMMMMMMMMMVVVSHSRSVDVNDWLSMFCFTDSFHYVG
jgi:hypothetical protein